MKIFSVSNDNSFRYILFKKASLMPYDVILIIEIWDRWIIRKPITPTKNTNKRKIHAKLMNSSDLGYLLTEMKFLKSFKSFNSSVSDLESDFYSLIGL